jgi:GNAT superfamily N-acetyltransferase
VSAVETRELAVDIRPLSIEEFRAAIPALADLILDAVAGGAGVNFLAGVTHEEATSWWRVIDDDVASGVTTVFAAFSGGPLVGSTLLARSTKQNSPHRAEIGKVIVLRELRRRGIAEALMRAAEEQARRDGRWLLILDTVEGSAAEALYGKLGWQVTGVVPNYALRPDGTPAPATFFWKDLRE